MSNVIYGELIKKDKLKSGVIVVKGEKGEPGKDGKDGQDGVVDYSLVLTKNNKEIYIPTSDYNPATKQYVDNLIKTSITDVLGGEY